MKRFVRSCRMTHKMDERSNTWEIKFIAKRMSYIRNEKEWNETLIDIVRTKIIQQGKTGQI